MPVSRTKKVKQSYEGAEKRQESAVARAAAEGRSTAAEEGRGYAGLHGAFEPDYLLSLFFEYPPYDFKAEYKEDFFHNAAGTAAGGDAAERRQKIAAYNAGAADSGGAINNSAQRQGAEHKGRAEAEDKAESGGLPLFSCLFNLLTTLEPAQLKRLKKLPFYRLLARILSFRTLFFGATVSEFAPLPPCFSADGDGGAAAAAQAADYLLAQAKNYPFVIVKDLPQQANPLISASFAAAAENFAAALQARGFIAVEGQALAYVPVDYADENAYLARFSKARRKDFRRKLRAAKDLQITILRQGDASFYDERQLALYYQLYSQVYAQSEIHFDRLSPDFFRALLQQADESLRFITYRDLEGRLIGYNICFIVGDKLVDKYIGLDYPAATDYSLYFVSWFYNLDYARAQGLQAYIAGWTDPQVKAYLGAKFVMTRHFVIIRNPLLRRLLTRFRHIFESDALARKSGDEGS